jgi:hypothetical protein
MKKQVLELVVKYLDQVLELVVKYLDLKGLVKEVIAEVADEALKKAVADSENTYDDMAYAALWPVMEKEALKLIDEKLDMSKLLGVDAE